MQPQGIVVGHTKLLYWSVPKAGCTSIKAWIAGICGFRFACNGDLHRLPFRRVAINESGGMHSFSVVRDPVTRLFSLWKDKMAAVGEEREGFVNGVDPFVLARFKVFHGGMPFEDFVDQVLSIRLGAADPHFMPQRMLRPSGRVELIDFENLDAGMNDLARRFDLPIFSERRHVMNYTAGEIEYLANLPEELKARIWRHENGLGG